MGELPKIAVCGCGSGGMAMAADLSLSGFSVNLYEHRDFSSNLDPIRANTGITLLGNSQSGKTGLAKLTRITDNAEEAIEDVEVIMINVPAPVVPAFLRALAPFFRSGQIVVVNTGYWSSLLSAKLLRDSGALGKITFVEEHIMPYLSRKIGPAQAHIYNYKRDIRMSAWPATKNEEAFRQVSKIYPQMKLSTNVLENNFQPGNSSVHAQINIPKAAFFFDRAREFRFYSEVSPCASKLADAFDEERRRVAAAFGFMTPSYVEWFNNAYGYGGENLYEIFGKVTCEHAKRWGNDAGNRRVIQEDLCYFFVPMEQFAALVGEDIPVTKACIEMLKVFTDFDYREHGIKLKDLGLEGMDRGQIVQYVTEGTLTNV